MAGAAGATRCGFHGRCPHGVADCEREMPALRTVEAAREAACHRVDALPPFLQ
jgi:ABC-type dipeptide/oligopeptide/nickel transport system ATPase component